MTSPLRTTRRRIAFGATLVALAATLVAALAVPSRPAAATGMSTDLTRDLDLASAAAVSLAPVGAGTQVVSALELGAAPERAPVARSAAPKRAAAPKRPTVRRPQPVRQVEPEPVAGEEPTEEAGPRVEEPAPTPVIDVPVTPIPRPIPNQRREPPGGWRTPSEVIRNAPFPINP